MEKINTSRKGSHNRIHKVMRLNEMYEYVNDKLKGTKYETTYKEFKAIITTFHDCVRQDVLNGEVFKFPGRFGYLVITKKKTDLDYKKIDYKKLLTTGDRVTHFNEHTGGYRMRISWIRKRVALDNVKYYSFIPERIHFKRALAKILKSPNRTVDYFDE